jgi:hypothetical protein
MELVGDHRDLAQRGLDVLVIGECQQARRPIVRRPVTCMRCRERLE